MSENAKKWWLWGCSGCLVISLVLFALTLVAGNACWSSLQQASNKAVEDIYGKGYKPPAGYIPLGYDGDEDTYALLTNLSAARMIVAVKSTSSKEANEVLASNDTELLQEYIQSIAKELEASDDASMEVGDLKFDETHVLTLDNGKMAPGGLVKSYDEDDGLYSPAAFVMLPQSGNHLVVLIALDINDEHGVKAADADLSKQQKELQKVILEIVADSQLDDQMP